MVRAHSVKLLLLLTLVTSSSASNSPTAGPTLGSFPRPMEAPTSITALTADYQINARDDHPLVQLSNGQYQQSMDPTSPDYATVFVSDFMAFGGLNADGSLLAMDSVQLVVK